MGPYSSLTSSITDATDKDGIVADNIYEEAAPIGVGVDTDEERDGRPLSRSSSSPFEPLMVSTAAEAAAPSSVRQRKQQLTTRSLYGEARTRILMIALCVSALLWMRHYCGGGGDDESYSLSSRVRGSTRGGDMPPSPPLDVKQWIDSLAESLANAKKELRNQLRNDYGMEVADHLFFGGRYDDDDEDSSVVASKAQNTVIRPADDSERGSMEAWDRMSRKIAVKMLQQAALLLPSTNEDVDVSGRSNPTTFVWATAGHSAAAGHGNYYNQSYTAVLEQRLQPFFQHFQLNFVGRNYAVGGSSSGPEVALCLGQLYGRDDVDILSWDYGMTDGNHYERLELFGIKAAQLPSRPALVAFTREESSGHNDRRRGAVARLGQYGMAAFVQDESEFLQQLRDHVPDTYGMTQEEIDTMSPYVKNLICQGQVEEGDPYCGDDKFDRSHCPDRRFMTSWHPGWKWHAYQGNVMAMFVVHAVEGAVTILRNRIEAEPDVNLTSLVDEWVDIERAEYRHVLQNVMDALPPYAHRFHPSQMLDRNGGDDDDDDGSAPTENSDTDDDQIANQWLRQLYYTAPNYCHIALLPSEIRYRGILDEYPSSPSLVGSSSAEPVNPVNFESALVKYPWELSPEDEPAESETESLSLTTNASSKMILVGDPDTRQVDCPIPLNVDHQDFFYVSQKDGWKHVDLPNAREVQSYGGLHRFNQSLHGVLAICYVGCPWDDCMDSDKRWTKSDNATNVVHMRVNGVDVTNLRAMSPRSNCHVLEHEHGYVWEPQPEATSTADRDAAEFDSIVEAGQFRVSARVSGPSSNYVRFSSFLLW